jgi:streptomycin 6-kinase
VAAPTGLPRLSDLVAEFCRCVRYFVFPIGDPIARRTLDAAIATVRELGPDQPETLVHGDLHDANVLPGEREPWLAIDPKGYVGDRAYDTITVIRSRRFAPLLFAADPRPGVLRGLDLFCDAADIDRDRARRWAQARAVQAALWGRRHREPDWLIRATDQLADSLS